MKTLLIALAAAVVFSAPASGQGLCTPSALTPDQLVTNMYQTILHRQPDPGGLEFWVGVAPHLPGLAIADYFMTSGEFIANEFSVMAAQWAMLGRIPTYAEWIVAVTAWRVNGGASQFTITDQMKADSNKLYAALVYYTFVQREFPDTARYNNEVAALNAIGPGVLFGSSLNRLRYLQGALTVYCPLLPVVY